MVDKNSIDASPTGLAAIKQSADPRRCLVYFDEDCRAHCPECAEKYAPYMVESEAVLKYEGSDANICDIDHEWWEQ